MLNVFKVNSRVFILILPEKLGGTTTFRFSPFFAIVGAKWGRNKTINILFVIKYSPCY
jgi:hypothetical protein